MRNLFTSFGHNRVGSLGSAVRIHQDDPVHDNPAVKRLAKVMRRQPVQQRGAATVTAILDACASLLNEHDYDDITTARIVERAGVPIGSFYQYFPDKRSVVHALALRGMQDYLGKVENVFSAGGLSDDWREAVAQVIGIYLGMLVEAPGFGRVRFSDLHDGHTLDSSIDQYELMAERLAELFLTRYPVRGDAPVALTFRMVAHTADALFKLAERVAPDERPQVLRTANGVILRMLSGVFDPA